MDSPVSFSPLVASTLCVHFTASDSSVTIVRLNAVFSQDYCDCSFDYYCCMPPSSVIHVPYFFSHDCLSYLSLQIYLKNHHVLIIFESSYKLGRNMICNSARVGTLEKVIFLLLLVQ